MLGCVLGLMLVLMLRLVFVWALSWSLLGWSSQAETPNQLQINYRRPN